LEGDFDESLILALNFGWDAEYNVATVEIIIGVTYCYQRMMNHNDRYNPEWEMVDRYKITTRGNMPMDETITSFADRIIELFEMLNEADGGKKTVVNNKELY
jgi:hypothetical protein